MSPTRSGVLLHLGIQPQHRLPAYVMPLAVAGAGLLLLMSGALHSLAMQERLQLSALERLRREEDLLVSAAHQLLAALNGPHQCLQALPLARWEADGGACASVEEVAALRQSQVMAVPVRLLAWQPRADGLAAELELALAAAPGRGARRARFGLQLAGLPSQAVNLRPRFIGGGLP
ncbi:MAG: hypothetical protein VKN56_07220 [Cyanobacteriota bacterium]|nr:hypothetical protein [Cyanobacteriota bacterium]